LKMFSRIKDKIKRKIKIIKLCHGLYNRFKMVVLLVALRLLRIFGINKRAEMSFKINFGGQTFKLFLGSGSDIAVLKEIFIDQEYNTDVKDGEIILDIGSNIGLASIYFKLKYPRAKIFAFEPAPDTFEVLKKNSEQFSDIKIFNFALGDIDGAREFYSSDKSSMSGSLIHRPSNQIKIPVAIKKLDSVIRELNVDHIDIVKFDIEGSEYSLLKDFKNFSKCKFFIGEIHLDLLSQKIEDFRRLFADNGFDCSFKKLHNEQRFIVRASRKF